MKIQVFDPPMCCATGVCGPSVDPEPVRFAADLDWLARQGVTVERYNLAQQAATFASNPVISDALEKEGNDCLPLTLVDGAVACKGKYPSRADLCRFAGVEQSPTLFTEAVKELVAIGAAIASNCEMCFKYHYNQARKLGVSKDDIRLAVEMAQAVKDSPARSVLALADKYLGAAQSQPSSSCCGSEGGGRGGCC